MGHSWKLDAARTVASHQLADRMPWWKCDKCNGICQKETMPSDSIKLASPYHLLDEDRKIILFNCDELSICKIMSS